MRTVLLIWLSVVSITLNAQSKTWDEVLEKLDSASNEYLNAFAQNDWDTYTEFTHPNIIEKAGGKEVVIKLASETVTMYKSIGYTLKEAKITGDAQSVDSEEGIQVIIPAVLVMSSSDDKTVESPMKLFAISADAGASWKFADLSQYDHSSIKTFVPEFSEELFVHW